MEIAKFVSTLDETISFLRKSHTSPWASTYVEEMIQQLESEIIKATKSQPIDSKVLSLLFAPTGAIQETAIDNGWGNEFLRISKIIDLYTSNDF